MKNTRILSLVVALLLSYPIFAQDTIKLESGELVNELNIDHKLMGYHYADNGDKTKKITSKQETHVDSPVQDVEEFANVIVGGIEFEEEIEWANVVVGGIEFEAEEEDWADVVVGGIEFDEEVTTQNKLQSPIQLQLKVDKIAFIEDIATSDLMNEIMNQERMSESHPFGLSSCKKENLIPLTIPRGAVNWVLVEIKDATNTNMAAQQKALDHQIAFIMNDGSILSLDGKSILTFDVHINKNLYVSLYLNNQIGLTSSFPLTSFERAYEYNFSIGSSSVFQFDDKGTMKATKGIWE